MKNLVIGDVLCDTADGEIFVVIEDTQEIKRDLFCTYVLVVYDPWILDSCEILIRPLHFTKKGKRKFVKIGSSS